MDIGLLTPNFSQLFEILWWLFIHGGWLAYLFIVIKILYSMYLGEIQHQFIHEQEWVFLSIKAPKENLVSTLAVESIYSQMHALHTGLTFAAEYVEGKSQLWYSLEIVSLGGKISFIVRSPKKTKDLVEAAFYSQYPNAEITEVHDYLENVEYDPKNSDFDLWGSEFKITEDESIPIKTYRDFEHPSAEEKIIDPLAGHFEALGQIEPHEFYGVQILIQPLDDKEWKPKGESAIKKLIGEEEEHETTITSLLLTPFNAVANFSFMSLLGGGHGHGDENEKKPKNNWQFMTEAQKERVNLIERKIGKPGYKTKIRHMYIAPKNKFDGGKNRAVIGSYRPLGSAMTNKFKPDTKLTWTRKDYVFSPTLEAPYIEYEVNRRKRNLFKGYKNRDIHIGNPMFVFNIEELSTIYHFPISTTPVSSTIDMTESKKSQAPINLPIVEEE